jgi:chaperonin cofactor prefoldin
LEKVKALLALGTRAKPSVVLKIKKKQAHLSRLSKREALAEMETGKKLIDASIAVLKTKISKIDRDIASLNKQLGEAGGTPNVNS